MAVELKVPEIGESITEVEIGEWFKKEGDEVQAGEAVVELESDKATIELPAPVAGTVVTILKLSGQTAQVGEVIGRMEEGAGAAKAPEAPAERAAPAPEAETVAEPPGSVEQDKDEGDAAAEGTTPAASAREETAPAKADRTATRVVMPGAQRLLAEHGLSAEEITASGPGGRLLKEDVLRHLASEPGEKESADESMPAGLGEPARQGAVKAAPDKARAAAAMPGESARQERKVRMSPMRRAIAQRLVTAQQSGALLTTFNEVNMQPVMAMRDDLREEFQERYGVKLGFMSFFVKACVEALRRFEMINAEIRGEDVVYKDYCDIGIAVSSAKGLVVPVLRNAERLTFGEIEMQIGDFAARGKENKIRLDELEGGTFTISNGGVFGSLLSTPIVNPPQSAVLGMHVVQDRPVAENGQVVIRPMMYVALTYDHRIVDGREAVSFLKTIKELLERPTRLVFKSLM